MGACRICRYRYCREHIESHGWCCVTPRQPSPPRHGVLLQGPYARPSQLVEKDADVEMNCHTRRALPRKGGGVQTAGGMKSVLLVAFGAGLPHGATAAAATCPALAGSEATTGPWWECLLFVGVILLAGAAAGAIAVTAYSRRLAATALPSAVPSSPIAAVDGEDRATQHRGARRSPCGAREEDTPTLPEAPQLPHQQQPPTPPQQAQPGAIHIGGAIRQLHDLLEAQGEEARFTMHEQYLLARITRRYREFLDKTVPAKSPPPPPPMTCNEPPRQHGAAARPPQPL